LKRSQPKRLWDDARAKVEREDRCRFCGCGGRLEAAHIMGRKYDKPVFEADKTLYVNPERIIPLCPDHHRQYDAHSLDILGYLAIEEQVQAVIDAGGIEQARRRLAPSAYLEVAA